MSRQATRRNDQTGSRRHTPQLKTCTSLVAAGVLALATSPTTSAVETTAQLNTVPTLPGACNAQTTRTELLEWDLSMEGNENLVPGALAVDDRSNSRQSRVWFATRNGDTRVYRFTPGRGYKKDAAEAKSWPLNAALTGGVRLRHSSDGRFVFVNTDTINLAPVAGVVAIDTSSDMRITWVDRPSQGHVSDVSVDTRGGSNNVFTAAASYQDAQGTIDGGTGVVQRLRPEEPKLRSDGQWIVPAEVTRWLVGNGAGTCVDTPGPGAPCIPGVVVDRRHGHAVFFAEPDFLNPDGSLGAIGELDPRPVKCPNDPYSTCAKVRHWPLPAFTASPRQILLDDTGRLWGITSSGNLFSLDIDRSYDKGTVTRHDPVGFDEDLFAVAPDGGTIGFTDSGELNNKVSMLFPQRVATPVRAEVTFVKSVTRRIDGVRRKVEPAIHDAIPRVASAVSDSYTIEGDGTYFETFVNTGVSDTGEGPSVTPTGIVPDGARMTGSFFYGATGATSAGAATNRIGHLTSQVHPDKETHHRKDDDDFDDDGDDDGHDDDDDNDGHRDDVDDDDDNDCILDPMDKDHDNDGVENEHDSKSHRENKRTDRGTMAPGESRGYDMEWDANSVLMVAIVEAADLSTPLSIEIVDANGITVLSTPAAVGKAVATATPLLPGLYTVRVKNAGLKSTTYKTTLIGKQIWF